MVPLALEPFSISLYVRRFFCCSVRIYCITEFCGTLETMDGSVRKVVLITGGNAGIGYSVVDRLLALDLTLLIILACRNLTKAEGARRSLLKSHPGATIEIVQLDTSQLSSVYQACAEIKRRFSRLDFLYLNAGILPDVSFNYGNFLRGLLNPFKFIEMFKTGAGLLNIKDGMTEDGLKNVFATNLFGHYVMIHRLLDLLSADGGSQIIWTSSSNARASNFSIDDIQNENSLEPYSGSKHAVDLLSQILNKKFNSRGIYSRLTCVGFSSTKMTSAILPSWMWYFNIPFFYLGRLVAPMLNITPFNGAEALVWLFGVDPQKTRSDVKYVSHTSFLGRRYVHEHQLSLDPNDCDVLYKKLDILEQSFRKKYGSDAKNAVSSR